MQIEKQCTCGGRIFPWHKPGCPLTEQIESEKQCACSWQLIARKYYEMENLRVEDESAGELDQCPCSICQRFRETLSTPCPCQQLRSENENLKKQLAAANLGWA